MWPPISSHRANALPEIPSTRDSYSSPQVNSYKSILNFGFGSWILIGIWSLGFGICGRSPVWADSIGPSTATTAGDIVGSWTTWDATHLKAADASYATLSV